MTTDTQPEDLTGRTVRIKPYDPDEIGADAGCPLYQPGDVGLVMDSDMKDSHLTYRVYVFYRPEPMGRETGSGMWFRRQDLEVVDA